MHSTPPPARPGAVTRVQLWILHSVKETNRAKKRKRKKVLGVGKREGSGRKCLVAATVILERGFRLISLTWLTILAELTLAMQETATSPQPGFSSPWGRFKAPAPPGHLPSPLPESRREPERPRPAGSAKSSRRASSQHPFPAPSFTSSQFLLSEKIGGLGSLLLSPKSEGETT